MSVTLPNFLETRSLSGDPGLPSIAAPMPTPVAVPDAPPPVVAPPSAVAPPDAAPSQPMQQPGFADALRKALPILIATIARAKSGPMAGAGLLKGYTDELEAQRVQQEHQTALDLAASTNKIKAQQLAQAEAEKKQGDLQNFIDHTRAQLNTNFSDDPAGWASTVNAADTAATKTFGAQPGSVRTHPLMQYPDAKASGKAAAEAQGLLDAAQKQVGPDQWVEMLKMPDQFAIGGKPMSDLLGAAKATVTKDGAPVIAAPKPAAEDENAYITRAISAENTDRAAKKLAPLSDTEKNTVALKARKEWAASSQSLGGMNALYGDVDPDAIAEAIIAGKAPPDISQIGRPAGAAVMSKLAKAGYDLSQAQLDWSATKKHVQTMNDQQYTALGTSAQSAMDGLSVVDDLSAKLSKELTRYKINVLNKAQLLLAKNGSYGQTAKDLATNLTSQISELQSNLSQVYSGGYAPTDAAMKLANKTLSEDWNQQTLRSATDLARKNLAIRINSIRQAQPNAVSAGNQYGAPPLPPPAADTRPHATGATPPADKTMIWDSPNGPAHWDATVRDGKGGWVSGG